MAPPGAPSGAFRGASRGDIEFLTDDGSVIAADEDVVEIAPLHPPRWTVRIAWIAAATAVAALIVTKPVAKPDAQIEAPVPTPVATGAPLGQLGPALWVGGAPDVLDVVRLGDRLVVLRSGSLVTLDLATKWVLDTLALTGAEAVLSPARMVVDPDGGRLWVVPEGSSPARVLEVDPADLRPIRHVPVAPAILDAAALDSHLYLATPVGLLDVAPSAVVPVRLTAPSGPVDAVAADAARHRLLVLSAPSPGLLSPVSISAVSRGRVSVHRVFGDLAKGSLASVGDDLWVGGYGDFGTVLVRLDPRTLGPIGTTMAARGGGGATVTAGERDIWVDTGGPGLWCVDADSGAILAQWPSASAPVSSRLGDAYVVVHGSVHSILLPESCNG
ncbi:MAG: hypothetical protein JWO57_341 [Pseudonocardiales bacterium]|nr:hypothetical protein [Pseudonocardiales bacterium]